MHEALWIAVVAMLLIVLPTALRALAATAKGGRRAIDDAWITAAIKGKLAEGELSGPRDIAVETHRGTVCLSGTVADDGMRRCAVELAFRVQGVYGVVNDLRIQGGQVDSPDDRAA